MADNSDKLIKSEIKGRKVTYYLTTEDDLHNGNPKEQDPEQDKVKRSIWTNGRRR